MDDNDTQTLRTAIMDISETRRAEEALARALKQQQQQIDLLQKRVLSVIAHEFRTPLATILSSVQLLENYGDRMSEDKKAQRHSQIRNLAWYLNDVVQDIQSMSASGNDLLPLLKPSSFDLLSKVREIVEDMASLFEGKQSEVVLEAEAIPSSYPVTWDQSLFRRVLINLLSNAKKYSDEAITCKIDIVGDSVRFQIADRGIGIPPEDLPHIYEPFYRGKNSEFERGTGIALYVVEQAVTIHNGTIHCETEPGKGTTFTVVLPRHSPAPDLK